MDDELSVFARVEVAGGHAGHAVVDESLGGGGGRILPSVQEQLDAHFGGGLRDIIVAVVKRRLI